MNRSITRRKEDIATIGYRGFSISVNGDTARMIKTVVTVAFIGYCAHQLYRALK